MTAQSRSAAYHWKLGDTGPAVAEIRERLARLGHLPAVVPHTHHSSEPPSWVWRFDEVLDLAVRRFQQDRNLTVDGVVGPETYRHLEEARWRLGDRILAHTVGRPMVGDDVAHLQRRLIDLGFSPGQVDGIFGPRTAYAVRDLQRNLGLPADGNCGPATFAALNRLARTVVGGDAQLMRERELLHRSGPSLPGKVVVLDPGHGGEDRGVVVGELVEAELMWELALRLEGRLTALGVRTYLTRGADHAVDEATRADFANATDADLVISLHVDRHRNPLASGLATYYYGADHAAGRSPTGERFAGLVQRELVARCGLGDNRIHGKTWTLLRTTRMPAVRIELGYLSNEHDRRRLSSAEFRSAAVEAIAVAVQRLYLPPGEDAPTGVLLLPAALTGLQAEPERA
ncbi:N-acetylmuramoyl-L-alanine amidase [Allostreptomyces psammosilenae]|uniref:N-acetylmuramoyl-L-alanine amidase n=1 Tax=Allostreptomyces psammosilenae TaxID=1892865 RepID=A0A852ZXG1_9ACTN|nr:N-acetylmuramoyl-L-alanine amidase [Allostreptomyces psammosilenae]NYI05414.1 N-acetylmuramoyl-L-alanine amidase [Allostreptomyces psammosilenae]